MAPTLGMVVPGRSISGAMIHWIRSSGVFGIRPNTRLAVLVFGLFHGLGLATRLQDFALPQQEILFLNLYRPEQAAKIFRLLVGKSDVLVDMLLEQCCH